jgi:DNA-binding SARP family transcriptional activator/TolB-like protein
MKPEMRIQLLGRFLIRLSDADERLIPVPSRRRRALLAYLAMQPGYSETRERLATLLWGEVPDRQARQSLRQALVAMRADFAPFDVEPLRVERDVVGLDPDLIAVDARQLLALADSERPEDVQKAAALLQGPFLDGIDLPAEGFAAWLRQQRHRIDTAAATVLGRGAEQADKDGNGPPAVHFAERLLSLDPARGSSQRLLLLLTAQHRGRDEAIARADSLNKTVREQFDVGLDAETRALIAAIKAGEFEPDRADGPRRAAPVAGAAERIHSGIDDKPEPGTRAEPMPADGAGADTGTAALRDMRPVVRKELEGQSKAAIVILPIVCEEAQSPELEREAARLSSDLIDFAPTITNLRVIAKSISSRLDARSIDAGALGRELGADYALEGSLRVLSGRLRVDIALIDLTTQLQAWNGYYESDETDAATRRLEIVRGLARQLVVAAVDVLGARSLGANQETPLADKLNRGWSLYQKFHSFRGGEEGERLFEEILRDHPANRSALIGLAGFKVAAAYRLARGDRQGLISEAEQLSQRALAIESQASLNQYNLGEIALLNGQVDEAVFRYERTLAINPIHAPSVGQLALIDLSRRLFGEGLAKLKYVVRLSPNDWSLGYWYSLRGRIHFEVGEDAEAERWLRAGMLESPNRPPIRAALAALYAETGQPERARRFADETRSLAPEARYETIRDYFFPGLIEPDEPRRMLSGIAKAFEGMA